MERLLTQCEQLLQGPSDEHRIAGLLMITKHLSNCEIETRRRIYSSLKGDNFLRRLLMTKSTSSTEKDTETSVLSSFQELGLNVLATLLSDLAIAKDFGDLVPSIILWIGELKKDAEQSWIDAVQCVVYILQSQGSTDNVFNDLIRNKYTINCLMKGLNEHCPCPTVNRTEPISSKSKDEDNFDAKANFDAMMKLGASLQKAKLEQDKEKVMNKNIEEVKMNVEHEEDVNESKQMSEDDVDNVEEIETEKKNIETRSTIEISCSGLLWILNEIINYELHSTSEPIEVSDQDLLMLSEVFYKCHTELKFDILKVVISFLQFSDSDFNKLKSTKWSEYVRIALYDIFRSRVLTTSMRDDAFVLLHRMLTLVGEKWFRREGEEDKFAVFALRLVAVEIKLLLDDTERLTIRPLVGADDKCIIDVVCVDRIVKMTPVMFSIVEMYISILATFMDDATDISTLRTDDLITISKSLGEIMYLVLEIIDSGGNLCASIMNTVSSLSLSEKETYFKSSNIQHVLGLLFKSIRLLGLWLAEETDALHAELKGCLTLLMVTLEVIDLYYEGLDKDTLCCGGLEYLLPGLAHLTTDKKLSQLFVTADGVKMIGNLIQRQSQVTNSSRKTNCINYACSILINLFSMNHVKSSQIIPSIDVAVASLLVVCESSLSNTDFRIETPLVQAVTALCTIRIDGNERQHDNILDFVKSNTSRLLSIISLFVQYCGEFSIDRENMEEDIMVLGLINISHCVNAYPKYLKGALAHDDRVCNALMKLTPTEYYDEEMDELNLITASMHLCHTLME